jgi:hypothetical protein
MSHWLDNPLQRLQAGEALIASGVEDLIQGWRTHVDVIDRIYTGAERWQAAIRQIQATATVNLVEILRARTFV